MSSQTDQFPKILPRLGCASDAGEDMEIMVPSQMASSAGCGKGMKGEVRLLQVGRFFWEGAAGWTKLTRVPEFIPMLGPVENSTITL